MTSTSPAPTPHAPPTAAPRPPLRQRILAYRILWIIGLSVFLLDQGTKFWINERLPFPTYGPPNAITVIDNFFYLVHVGNTGAAWSMFTGKSAWLAGIALITLIGIYFWRHSLGLRERVVQISFGLLCGGIVGNLVDRVLHGHVIDLRGRRHLPDLRPAQPDARPGGRREP
jgi:signal peptidase II